MKWNREGGRLRRRIASAAAVAALIAGAAVAAGPASALPSPSETLGPANFTGSSWLNLTDAPANIVKVGSTLYAMTSEGGSQRWDRWQGTTVDNMGSNQLATRSGFPTNLNYAWWLTNVWIQPGTGTWYGIVHSEFNLPNGNYARQVGLATSSNLGLTWNWAGWILTQDASFVAPAGAPAGSYTFGVGDQRLVVDTAGGYFYLFYATGYRDPVNHSSQQSKYMHYNAARCPIANIATTTCWTKWYGSSFSEAGIGGHDGTVMPFTGIIHYGDPAGQFSYEDTPAFTYSTALNKFIAMGHDWISTTTDLTNQAWSSPVTLTGGTATDNCWYLWPVDPATGSTYSVGSSFRLYGNATGLSGCAVRARYATVDTSGNPAATTSWSASNGYTHNQWRSEYATSRGGTTFLPMEYVTAAGGNQYQWKGSETYCTVFSGTQQHPGYACDSSRTWQAPISATVTLGSDGSIQVPGSCGNTAGVTVRILKNTTQIWAGAAAITNGGAGLTFPGGVTTTVAPGDLLRFVVSGVGGSIACDATTWNATITANTGLQNIVWKASDGFTQGWDQWRAEYTTVGGTSMSAMAYSRLSREWESGQPYCTVFSPTEQHPGLNCDSVRTWVAPSAGTVTIGANGPITVGGPCGNTAGVNLRILKNGTQIWPGSGYQNVTNGGSYTFPSGITSSVAVGDRLSFVVQHAGSSIACDATDWDVKVNF
ncbi:hypothetical protein [Protaetiibacter mangrovi]|uniref:Ig-like domain-containing protein n=1 Tax=Protaetiibacter mangrovi TaxID=2970926 RepID=A0ABT1ZGP9_9MICO|nr:hypothetical protein [Protaetiibacter mangrovi]MCS0499881.1 hypothetical protein [Protaetiibacter mangrovi]TPX05102.1 hypothetical protein FJ656_08325 [Schumannella luteola]